MKLHPSLHLNTTQKTNQNQVHVTGECSYLFLLIYQETARAFRQSKRGSKMLTHYRIPQPHAIHFYRRLWKSLYRLEVWSQVTGKHVLLLIGLHWYRTKHPPFLTTRREGRNKRVPRKRHALRFLFKGGKVEVSNYISASYVTFPFLGELMKIMVHWGGKKPQLCLQNSEDWILKATWQKSLDPKMSCLLQVEVISSTNKGSYPAWLAQPSPDCSLLIPPDTFTCAVFYLLFFPFQNWLLIFKVPRFSLITNSTFNSDCY